MECPLVSQSSKVGMKAHLSDMMRRGFFITLLKMRTGEGQQKEHRDSHMIFADNFLFATSEEEIRKMIADTSEKLRQ